MVEQFFLLLTLNLIEGLGCNVRSRANDIKCSGFNPDEFAIYIYKITKFGHNLRRFKI